jgi:hypothetical protein
VDGRRLVGIVAAAFSVEIAHEEPGVVAGGRIHRRMVGECEAFAGAGGRVGERDRCADLLPTVA